MMKTVITLLGTLELKDVVDIALLAAIFYWLLLLIKGTRTIPILIGLTVLLAAYALAAIMNLEAIGWLMENLFSSVVVILVVLFQSDIRNALAQVGISTMLREMTGSARTGLIDIIVEGAYTLAQRKIGATLVLENDTGLRNYIERGKIIMALPTVDLLVSIFQTGSPLHDGAVIIDKEGHLAAAGCILPLTINPVSDPTIGTRHRSALGLSEETDALVVVVSEERGNISLAFRGQFVRNLEPDQLRQAMSKILEGDDREDAISKNPSQTQTV